MHHSSDEPLQHPKGAGFTQKTAELEKKIREMTVGPTKEFPGGKYGENDEGALRYGVASDRQNARVLLDFGVSIRSMGMTPAQARKLAKTLLQAAGEAAPKKRKNSKR